MCVSVGWVGDTRRDFFGESCFDDGSAELPRLGGVSVCEREGEKEREGLGEGLGALINLR